jgi:hypothetical protein
MIARAAPLIADEDRIFAAWLAAERLCETLKTRAALRARARDGRWHHFVDSGGGVHSELR